LKKRKHSFKYAEPKVFALKLECLSGDLVADKSSFIFIDEADIGQNINGMDAKENGRTSM
jgi:hypothetical protein